MTRSPLVRRTNAGRAWKLDLEEHSGEDRPREGLAPRERRVREQVVERPDEPEDERGRDGERVDVGEDAAGDSRVVDEVDADGADHERDEEHGEGRGDEREHQELLAHEGAVREPVDDVERGLENAEEAERAPEERDPADDPDRRGLVLNRADDAEEAVDRARGEGAPQLLDEVARLRLLPGERGQREREEEEGDEREEREVGDHRREMRSTVCEELGDDAMHARRSVGRARDGQAPGLW